MVAANGRNPLRGDWRDQSGQCTRNNKGGRGFHRRVFGGLGSSGWARNLSATALSAMFGILILNPAFAQSTDITLEDIPTIDFGPAGSEASYDKAVSAYELRDFSTALSQAKVAAAQGHSDAQVMTAHILLRGDAGFTDYNQAVENYRKAALQKNTDAYMGLGEMALRSLAGLTPSDAVSWFSAAAQDGRKDAMRALGEMYLKGQGIPPNPQKGQEWLDKAADGGDDLAHRKMADSLFETDPVKAHVYYKKAADAGDNEAAYIAAIMYEDFFEIKPDADDMARLYRQAALSGNAAAQADYGLLLYQGRGVVKDNQEAAEWFGKAAKGGDKEGMFLYAVVLAQGVGVSKNVEDAYYWILKSGGDGDFNYFQERLDLKQEMEQKVDPSTLARARARL